MVRMRRNGLVSVRWKCGEVGFQNGYYGRNLAAKKPQWAEKLIGREIYQYTMVIMREYGGDTKGRKINSRKTTGRNAKRPWGARRRLEIDRSKSVAAKHEKRSDESRHRESV